MLKNSLVKTFYLRKDSFPENIFLRWRQEYVSIHGNHQSQRTVNRESLEQKYNIKINNKDDLYWLIFCLERFYEISLRAICANSLIKENPTLNQICSVKFFENNGLKNYLEDIPNNLLENLDDNLIQKEINNLCESNKNIIQLNNSSEIIHEIFEDIFPRALRHSLGEYYTPSWLVDFTVSFLEKENKINNEKLRVLDPTCGSGSFISGIIRILNQKFLQKAFVMVEGFDIRWLSVLAARTNFVLQYISLVGKPKNLYIPIWVKDIFESSYGQKDFLKLNQTSNKEEQEEKKYDFILGNPPWVNWEYLPIETKNRTESLWKTYGLWTSKGFNKGFVKEDISSLATYIVADKFLKNDGLLYFLLKESLFKSSQQGEGFRNFKINTTKQGLCPIRVDDFSEINTFQGASTRAFLACFMKGRIFQFPVKFTKWKKKVGVKGRISSIEQLAREELQAIPSDKLKLNSGWISYLPSEKSSIEKYLGKSFYEARTGVFSGGLNSVFWVKILNNSLNNVYIKNTNERAKNKVQEIEHKIEKDLLYPLAGGSDLKYWDINYSKYIILPHSSSTKMRPISFVEMKRYPQTLNYLKKFKKQLSQRKGFTSMDRKIRDEFFYTLQRIGVYTFHPYKVGWKYISKSFTPCVFSSVNDRYLGKKLLIPNEKIIYIGFKNESEAFYLCGLLSSFQYKDIIQNYIVGTQITPGIIKKLNIKKYDQKNIIHVQISQLCMRGHESSLQSEKDFYQAKISELVEDLSI